MTISYETHDGADSISRSLRKRPSTKSWICISTDLRPIHVEVRSFIRSRCWSNILFRYKMIANSTWPIWRGDDKAGTQEILNKHGMSAEEYRMGKTKVFILKSNYRMMKFHWDFLTIIRCSFWRRRERRHCLKSLLSCKLHTEDLWYEYSFFEAQEISLNFHH